MMICSPTEYYVILCAGESPEDDLMKLAFEAKSDCDLLKIDLEEIIQDQEALNGRVVI